MPDFVKIYQHRTLAANVEFLEGSACTVIEAKLLKNMQFDDDPCTIKDYIKKQLSNQSTFNFMSQKSACGLQRNTIWSSNLLFPIAASLQHKNYETQKRKKRKSYMNAPNLHKKCCFFPSNDEHKSFLQSIHYTEKKHKNTQKINTQKYTITLDYKNHNISILQINQIIFYLFHLTIFRNFVLS